MMTCEEMQQFIDAKNACPRHDGDAFVVDDIIIDFLKMSPDRSQFEEFIDNCLISKTVSWALWAIRP